MAACWAAERGCLCRGTCVGEAAAPGSCPPRCCLAPPEMKPRWQPEPCGGQGRAGPAQGGLPGILTQRAEAGCVTWAGGR